MILSKTFSAENQSSVGKKFYPIKAVSIVFAAIFFCIFVAFNPPKLFVMKKILFLALLAVLSFSACNMADSMGSSVSNAEKNGPKLPEDLKVSWEIKQIVGVDDEEAMNPLASVSIKIGNKSFVIDSISGEPDLIEPAYYSERDIPQDALSACGGFWAGLGVYYFAIKHEDSIKIFVRYEEEGYMDEETQEMVHQEPTWEFVTLFTPEEVLN